jgi:hypothetical protein
MSAELSKIEALGLDAGGLLSVCEVGALDQARKGIWWMPWH